jgi:uncharacterized protein (DUF1015 family)
MTHATASSCQRDQTGAVPELHPFRALRYDPRRVRLDEVVAPPHDLVGPGRRAELAASHPHHAVRLDLPEDGPDEDRYAVGIRRLESWMAEGVLVRDPEPSLTVYRMEYRDGAGRPRHTQGVVGAVSLHDPEEGQLLPHEATTPEDSDDRLRMLRATRANLSPIWCLSPAPGLTAAITAAQETGGEPDAEWVVPDGTRHRLWRVTDPAHLGSIGDLVGSAPLLIADGHHRYETALRYREERHTAGDGAGPWDRVMAYVVELAPEELTIRPIHRVVRGLPAGFDAAASLAPWFDPTAIEPAVPTADLDDFLVAAGAPALVTPGGRWLLRPRPERLAGVRALDSSRLDAALPAFGEVDLQYVHGTEAAVDAVTSGHADAAVLLRPATITQIEAIAHGGERMPPKTTFFSPKPSTGALFRLLD